MLAAEWFPQAKVILTWPHGHSDWQNNLAEVEQTYQAMVHAIIAHQPLLIICYDAEHQQYVAQQLPESHNLSFVCCPSNDTWIRDYGPLSNVINGKVHYLDFKFNAWGDKYAWQLDNKICSLLLKNQQLNNLQQIDYVLEGGAVDSDGQGTLLTTSNCLLHPSRNGACAKAQVEHTLKQYLQAQRVLWLDHGFLMGDDTDGHVDMLARFVAADTICYQSCDDQQDPHFAALQAMAEQLQLFKQADGSPYHLQALPWPQATMIDDERVPLSYANFLIINDAVLVPQYQQASDEQALAIIQQCFAERTVYGINCLPLVRQGGSLHCASIQIHRDINHD